MRSTSSPYRTRLRLLAIVALTLVFALVFVLWFGLPATWAGRGITEANYARIQPGMTEQEVNELLGCKSGHYSLRINVYAHSGLKAISNENGEIKEYYRSWSNSRCQIQVIFDTDNKVLRASLERPRPLKTWLEWLQDFASGF